MTATPRQPRYCQIFEANEEMAELACEYWKVAINHLTENGLVTQARARTADRYARACAEFEIVHKLAQADGPVKSGPNGGDVFNFYWSAAEKLNERIAKFEDALLISARMAGDKLKEKPADVPKSAADEFLAGDRPN